MITKTCPCGIVFEYTPNNPAGTVDGRKYCDPCRARRKVEEQVRDNQQLPSTQSPQVPANPLQNGLPKVPATGNENMGIIAPETGNFQSTVWNHQVRPHSSEMGPAGNRHKIYWETVEELKAKMQELRDAGLMDLPLDKKPMNGVIIDTNTHTASY